MCFRSPHWSSKQFSRTKHLHLDLWRSNKAFVDQIMLFFDLQSGDHHLWPLEGNRADPGKIHDQKCDQNSGDHVPPPVI